MYKDVNKLMTCIGLNCYDKNQQWIENVLNGPWQ
jgi:hypothetical protein